MRRVWYIETMVHYPEGDHDSFVDNVFLSEEDAIDFLQALKKEEVDDGVKLFLDGETVFSYTHPRQSSEVVILIREAYLHTGEDDDA